MPVHTREADGILYLVLDGDFTTEELERVGTYGLGGAETGEPVSLLLDASGAAGLNRRDPDDFDAIAAFLGAHAARLSKVALLAPGDPAFALMHAVALRTRGHGVDVSVFRTRGEAEEWLGD